ncbi:hypothetical protein EDC30_109106 [Paucimonas lemoignei]|uniref:Putative tail fiber protein gp53-like C-terminal domain-containing protein n=1 Tax=Paucimonas lemoignei TaxID=29443 RepID=A0A4R3HRQ5_PAULE|nr:hypothetical protein [Paucimonas lemoignei]TCS35807.1 hypothetical protein EDC30_109106 [Paucimonas lemoignei]
MDYPLSRSTELDLYNGKFDDGVPGIRKASIIPSRTFNQVMDELLAVIVAAGLTPNENSSVQLLAALRASGVFATPLQFDSSTKAATTEFVKSSGFQFAGETIINVSATLTAAHIGKAVILGAGVTITLPAANAFPSGSTIVIVNANSNSSTVQRGGTDVIGYNTGTGNSLTLTAGDSIVLETAGTSYWRIIGGSAMAQFTGSLANNKATNGYTKLQNGIIFQWGISALSGSLTTWPIAFPNSCLSCAALSNSSATTITYSNLTATGTTFSMQSSTTGANQSANCLYICVGH